MSYCPLFKIHFPDFSRLCFHISEWKLVGSFHIKSYRSSSTFATVDPLLHELLPFVQFFPDFSWIVFTYMKKVGRKLPYEEFQIKFHFVTVDLLLNDLLPFLKKKFCTLFFLLHEELHIKFETSNNKSKALNGQSNSSCSLFKKKHRNNGCRFEFVGIGGGPVLLLYYSQYAC